MERVNIDTSVSWGKEGKEQELVGKGAGVKSRILRWERWPPLYSYVDGYNLMKSRDRKGRLARAGFLNR